MLSGVVMKRFCYFPLLVILLGQISTAVTDEKLKIKNDTSQQIEIRIFSEKELKWLEPSIKLDRGKSSEWTVKFTGDHNIKLMVNGKEHLMGTYDLQAIIKEKNVDELEFGHASTTSVKSPKASDGKTGGKTGKDGGKDSVTVKPKGKKKASSGKKMRTESRTRMVSVTKMRAETRTRTVRNADGTETEMVYTVMVPYTEQVQQTYQVQVPVDGEEGSEKSPVKGSAGSKSAKLVLTFKSRGKAVQVKDSLQKK